MSMQIMAELFDRTTRGAEERIVLLLLADCVNDEGIGTGDLYEKVAWLARAADLQESEVEAIIEGLQRRGILQTFGYPKGDLWVFYVDLLEPRAKEPA